MTYEREYYEEKTHDDQEKITIDRSGSLFVVTGKKLKHLCDDVNFEDRDSLSYFQRKLRSEGVIDLLEKNGINEGDTVSIYGVEFEFQF
ncbi:MAG: Obg family GTPase CgtA [Clostridia bacterium]